MKKIMFGLAAAIAMVAAADIESSNIVGYKEYNLNAGYGMTTMTFKPMSGTEVNVQDIIPQGDGVGGYGDVVIQVMNAEGEWAGEYSWWTEENSGNPTGWYDAEDNLVSAAIKYGEGMFVQASEGVHFTYSGEVPLQDVVVELPEGYSMTGVAVPVDVSVQSIVPQGDGVGGYGDVVIQVMNSEGEWAGEYAWWTEENSGNPTGWYDAEDNLVTATIPAGEGVFVQTSAAGVSLKVPRCTVK